MAFIACCFKNLQNKFLGNFLNFLVPCDMAVVNIFLLLLWDFGCHFFHEVIEWHIFGRAPNSWWKYTMCAQPKAGWNTQPFNIINRSQLFNIHCCKLIFVVNIYVWKECVDLCNEIWIISIRCESSQYLTVIQIFVVNNYVW